MQQNEREVSAAKAEAASIKAAFNAQLQVVQNQLKEAQESYELKLMMTASDAMERENKTERQLKETERTVEELRRKLSQAERQAMHAATLGEGMEANDESAAAAPQSRQQLPFSGFSQKNLLLKSAPQSKRPRTEVSQQPLPQPPRAPPVPSVSGEPNATPRSQTPVGFVGTPGAPESCTSLDSFRNLVRLNSRSSQQRTISPEMRFVQMCVRNGSGPFKNLLQALGESGALGESPALMRGAELMSTL